MKSLHYDDALAGRLFWQQTSAAAIAGLALPIYSATSVGGGSPLYNPQGSNRNIEVVSLDVVYASGTGAATFDGIFMMQSNVNGIGTATGCSVFTSTTPFSGLLGVAPSNKCLSCNGGTVTVTAGIATAPVVGVVGAGVVRSIFSTNVEAATATPHGTLVCRYDFNGTVIMPPGTLIYFAAIVASVSLYNTTLVWKEYPIAANMG